jgi:hypothetical protein
MPTQVLQRLVKEQVVGKKKASWGSGVFFLAWRLNVRRRWMLGASHATQKIDTLTRQSKAPTPELSTQDSIQR